MDFIKKEIVSIHAAAFLIGAAGFLSRLLGLFRDRLLAGEFGASRDLDIYYASFQIPDFIFTIFLLGSATAAIIPVFLDYWERDKDEARMLVGNLFNVFLIFSAFFWTVRDENLWVLDQMQHRRPPKLVLILRRAWHDLFLFDAILLLWFY